MTNRPVGSLGVAAGATALMALTLAAVLLAVVPAPRFSPDSWSYYELARSLGADPYRFTTWRSYAFDAPYSSAFPPLWPTLIASAGALTGTGPVVSVWLAWAAFAGFCVVSEAVGRAAIGLPWIGAAAALFLAADPTVLDEILGGRAIPLHLLLVAAAALIVMAPRGWVGRHVALGAILGLAALNRFDALPLAVGFAALALGRWRNPVGVVAMTLTGLLTLSPWIAHSLLRFGVPMVTDNAGAALSLDPLAYVTDWWPTPQPSLSDDPAAWAARVTGNLQGYALAQLRGVWHGAWWLPVAGVAVAVLAKRGRRRDAAWPAGAPWLLALILPLMLPSLSNLVTGYFDTRYFAPLRWWACLMVLGVAGGLTAGRPGGQWVGPGALALAALWALWLAAPAATRHLGEGRLAPPPAFAAPPEDQALRACLGASTAAVMFDNPVLAAGFGARTGITSLMRPANWDRLAPEERTAFLVWRGVTHLAPGALPLPVATRIEPVACPLPLWRVRSAP